MGTMLIAATAEGLAVCERQAAGWGVTCRGLVGRSVTSVIARQGVILAGTTAGVFRSDDLGATWQAASAGLSAPHVRWLAYHPDVSDFEFAGTEPAEIFISHDGAQTWRSCPEVSQMRARYGWALPYSPQAGCVRGFAIQARRAYAAVEDGCVLVSDDRGETWQLAAGSRGYPDHRPSPATVHSDVHSIAVHPTSPDLVFAPTGGGFYRSADGGKTWDPLYPGCYCRAVWADPVDPTHLVLGPADGVDYNGRIEETHDSGHTWQSASYDLPVPWLGTMVERFTPLGGELMAVLSDGTLLSASLPDLHWQPALAEVAAIRAVTGLEV
jgi:hypothetical protein